MEETYVKDTYNTIATQFDSTRYCTWACVENFFKDVSKESYILEAGCGNGKNLQYLFSNGYKYIKGCDFCNNFVKICKLKSLDVIEADVTNLPYEDNSFDIIICIAVIHHLSTSELRIKAINELIRIIKPTGKILITVSSYEEPFYEDCDLTSQDVMIPWKDRISKKIIAHRYYHLFKKNELESLIVNDKIKSIESFYELKNWGVILTKI